MTVLEDVALDDLHAALEDVEGKKPTQRLLLAILYKEGPSVPTIAEWFDLRERLLYRWFAEMDDGPLTEAIYDDPRPGRPPKLTDDQRSAFEAALEAPPAEAGYDAPTWTPELARTYLGEEFDVEYTCRHVRRLLRDARISLSTPRPGPSPGAGERERNRGDSGKFP